MLRDISYGEVLLLLVRKSPPDRVHVTWISCFLSCVKGHDREHMGFDWYSHVIAKETRLAWRSASVSTVIGGINSLIFIHFALAKWRYKTGFLNSPILCWSFWSHFHSSEIVCLLGKPQLHCSKIFRFRPPVRQICAPRFFATDSEISDSSRQW